MRLRQLRRRADLVGCIPGVVVGAAAGFAYFANREIDPSAIVFGMDPLAFNGMMVVACGAAGFFVGGPVGKASWSLVHRKQLPAMAKYDKLFTEHIVKNRVRIYSMLKQEYLTLSRSTRHFNHSQTLYLTIMEKRLDH